jgi:RNA polymerase sigma factor (sigma-70 family)
LKESREAALMIHFATMSDENLLTMYYNEEVEQLADLAFAELDRRYRTHMLLTVTVPGYNKHFVKLYRKPGQEHKAEELVSEALLRVADTRGRPSARWNPARQDVAPWIFGILRNVVISYLRKKKRNVVTDSDLQGRNDADSPPYEWAPDETHNPESVVQQAAMLQAMQECLEELPEELRTICELIYGEGLKQAEIAARLQVSAPTLTRRKQDACALLKECLRRRGVVQEVAL